MSSFSEQLIAEVRSNPVLYDKSCHNYKTTKVKVAAWRQIAMNLNTTDGEVVRKWKTLRDRFRRQLLKLNQNGSSTNSPVKWELFGHLQFLRDHMDTRREPSPDYNNYLEDGTLLTPSSSNKNKDSKGQKRKILQPIDEFLKFKKSKPPVELDAEDHFGSLVAKQLKLISEPSRSIIMANMSKLLADGIASEMQMEYIK